ncbi:uncharacterized protein LOC108596256 isoform X2 [Drosophila busckii]|uniref:uncharacterized protein LOC108596256 isoform X2 n=1 Tax=Drosophila busckii TaxID=30019 RepID=UPI00083F31C0|nr:uncharacterized protein LOC108596256 isoform X2 [Drosophila busckii]
MHWILSCLLIFSALCWQLEAEEVEKEDDSENEDEKDADRLGLGANYNEILIDVIKSWQTPIVQLTELGYLPDNYEDTSKIKPNLDALLDRLESYKQQLPAEEQAKPNKRKIKSKAAEQRKERETKLDAAIKLPTADDIVGRMLKEEELKHQKHEPNMQLLLMGHLLAKQQQQQVKLQPETPETGAALKPAVVADNTLERLLKKTSPLASDSLKQKLVKRMPADITRVGRCSCNNNNKLKRHIF